MPVAALRRGLCVLVPRPRGLLCRLSHGRKGGGPLGCRSLFPVSASFFSLRPCRGAFPGKEILSYARPGMKAGVRLQQYFSIGIVMLWNGGQSFLSNVPAEYKVEVPEKQLQWQRARAILSKMIFGVTCCAEVSGTNTGRGGHGPQWGLESASTGIPAGRGALSVRVFPLRERRWIPVPAFLRVASRGEGRRKRGMNVRTTRNSGGSEHRKGSWIHGTTF